MKPFKAVKIGHSIISAINIPVFNLNNVAKNLVKIWLLTVLAFYNCTAPAQSPLNNNLTLDEGASTIPTLNWTRQVGAVGGNTQGNGISADNSGNIYVTGMTNVGLSGQKQNGVYDYFIAKYDLNGNLQWSRQVGTTNGTTQGRGISMDNSGNINVTGYTTVGVSGQSQKGLEDYFIAKYIN